jgi:drug/metabolite transporter (DMT)-like permease
MKNIMGKIYLLLAFSLAGTSVITGYILSEKLSSFTITAVSLGIMLLGLSPFYGARAVQTIRRLNRSDWKMLVLQAIFGIFLFRIFLLSGVGLTSTVEAGILTGTTPAITSVLAFFVLREMLSGWAALGIAGTVLGIALLQGVNLYSAAFFIQHIWGNILVLCAAASESAFNIISRRQRAKQQYDPGVQIHPMVQTLLVSTIAFVLSIIPALGEQPLSALPMIGAREWLALLWYGLIVTALAFVFFYEGVKRCDAYTTAAFSGMMPLTSMLLSLFFLHEPIGYGQCAGGFLIISSMLLIGRNQSPKSINKIPPSSACRQTGSK